MFKLYFNQSNLFFALRIVVYKNTGLAPLKTRLVHTVVESLNVNCFSFQLIYLSNQNVYYVLDY